MLLEVCPEKRVLERQSVAVWEAGRAFLPFMFITWAPLQAGRALLSMTAAQPEHSSGLTCPGYSRSPGEGESSIRIFPFEPELIFSDYAEFMHSRR